MQHSTQGFTLIELILTISIISIVTMGGIIGYSGYESRQKLDQAAKTLESDMRYAQSQSLAGAKPTACGTDQLRGWFINLSASSYEIKVLCGSQNLSSGKAIVTLPSGFALTGNNVIFQPVNDGVAIISGTTVTPIAEATTIKASSPGGSEEITVTISKSGLISSAKTK